MKRYLALILILLCIFGVSCDASIKHFRTATEEERDAVVSVASKYIGKPYVWGGQTFWNEEGGIDCSGLIINVYKEALSKGSLPFNDTTVKYLASKFSVPVRKPEKGDLIFMGDGHSSIPSHVAIFVSENDGLVIFIDASSLPSTGKVMKRHYKKDNPKIISFGAMKIV